MTPRSSPASSDASLRDHELNRRVRALSLDSPEALEGYRPLRVVMVQTAAGLKPPSGGFRGNYATLFALVKHGHSAMQTCWAFKKDINEAIAELRSQNKFAESGFTWGSTYMTDANNEKVKVTWWRFLNVHDILCVALDAETMIKTFPNHLQQVDAAIYIEASPSELTEFLG